MTMNLDKLNFCLESWRETFNDCACCPLSPYECDEEDDDFDVCVKRIIRWLTDSDEVIKPQ